MALAFLFGARFPSLQSGLFLRSDPRSPELETEQVFVGDPKDLRDAAPVQEATRVTEIGTPDVVAEHPPPAGAVLGVLARARQKKLASLHKVSQHGSGVIIQAEQSASFGQL